MKPKVSIIVPCWGVEKYLNQTVESLTSQTLEDLEIILVDDESPDRVPEMCDDWAKKDSRIKVVHKKNGGLGLACNSGLEVATGDYVAFCDSDDWIDRNAYKKMYENALEKNADLIMTSFKYVDLDGTSLQKQSLTYSNRLYSGSEIHKIMKGIIASSPDCADEREFQASAKVTFYKNEIIRKFGLQFVSERIIPSEDLIFNLDYLAHCNSVQTISEKYYNYRFNPESISHHVKRDAYKVSKNLYQVLRQKINTYGLGIDGIYRIQRMFIGTTRATVARIIKSDLSADIKKELLNEICKDSLLKDIYRDYPVNSMPLKHRFFLWATIKGIHPILNLMTKFMH